MIETAIVLGATGGIGKAVTDALIFRNINTKILVRSQKKYLSLYPDEKLPGRVSVVEGELDSNLALATALEYADTVFVCFNTSFRHWSKKMPKWIARVADLSAALQARIIFPGNIYNFGATDALRITEEHPQDAHTRKGQLRIALEQRLIRSALEGASLTILRFPDFFGPAVTTHPVSSVFHSALSQKRCSWYGDPYNQHEFISTIDAGEVMVQAALEPKAADTVLHVGGYESITAHEFIKLVYEEVHSDLSNHYTIIPEWKLRLTGLLKRDISELSEMLYLYRGSMILDSSKYEQIVGPRPVRPFSETIKETVNWYKFWLKQS
ncbi:MAG: NmrA family NAD(P)-binding protein [Candidatus Kariarchaeaceae archaeon]